MSAPDNLQNVPNSVAPLESNGLFGRAWYLFFQSVIKAGNYCLASVADLFTRVTTLEGAGYVKGAANLTSVGKIPKVSAAGTVTQSSLTDNGTNVSGTEPLHLDTGAAPANSQVTLKANALGVLSLKCQAADNQTIGFDVDYVAAAWIAANASIGLFLKNGAQLILIGSVGNVVGNAATLTNLFIFDLATGNLDLAVGGYKVGGVAGITATITTAKLTGGGANGSMTFTKGILTAQTAAT